MERKNQRPVHGGGGQGSFAARANFHPGHGEGGFQGARGRFGRNRFGARNFGGGRQGQGGRGWNGNGGQPNAGSHGGGDGWFGQEKFRNTEGGFGLQARPIFGHNPGLRFGQSPTFSFGLQPVPLPFGQFPPVPAGGGDASLLAAGSGLAQFGGAAAQFGGGMIAGGVAQGSTAAQHGAGLTGAGAQTSSNSGGNGSVLAGIAPFGDNVHLPGGVAGDRHLTAVGESGASAGVVAV
ncbi:Os01g0557700 [Oryza sativa Japonica Group]|uniref:Os01g0557700 protein n=1 Tax=Oryza sativa subsp. japonica TaxID=39947 RepID=A0A0P0V475_ORYSJ|nr:Os01g0557700 [Oryza sativa Japonica Group]